MKYQGSLAERKSVLARLLAAENISVQHVKAKTAWFNLETRTLNCPIWEDMSGELYDLLMGHEVGHALYTPKQGWHDAVIVDKRKNFKGFLNVIEDARIEKKQKRKFPGLRRSFFEAYKILCDRNFFGIKGFEGYLDQLNLIDRINLYTKCAHLKVPFKGKVEHEFVKRTEDLETWEEVEKLANDLYEYVKTQEQNAPRTLQDLMELLQNSKGDSGKPDQNEEDEEFDPSQEYEESGESEDSDESDELGENDKELGDKSSEEGKKPESGSSKKIEGKKKTSKKDKKEGSESESDDSDKSKKKKKKSTAKKNSKGGDDGDSAPNSLTDEIFRKKENTLVDVGATTIYYCDLPDVDLSKTIIPLSVVVNKFDSSVRNACLNDCLTENNGNCYDQLVQVLLHEFNERNSTYISLLVKEFEMRKNASAYARQLISKTGDIDTNQLARYKFTNDIFRKVTTVEKGKSHGMILFLDMSCSMSRTMKNIVEQLLILVTFCKKVGIPFDVYGFCNTSRGVSNYKHVDLFKTTKNSFQMSSGSFHLKHLISSSISSRFFHKAYNNLLVYTEFEDSNTKHSDNLLSVLENISTGTHNLIAGCGFDLSGTPFNETLIASRPIITKFRNKYRNDIVNVIYLTDGEGSNKWEPSLEAQKLRYSTQNTKFGIVDPITKKRRLIIDNDMQTALTIFIRDITNCRHIGFYATTMEHILDIGEGYFKENFNKSKTEINGYVSVPHLGYDSYYYIDSSRKNRKVSMMDITRSNTNLQEKFRIIQQKKKGDRAILSQFAEEISNSL